MQLLKRYMGGIFVFFMAMMTSQSLSSAQVLQEPIIQDNITLQLVAEEWLTAQGAEVDLQIVALFNESERSNVRSEVNKKLNQLSKKDDWVVTSFRRVDAGQSASGLESWTVRAQGRLMDKEIDNLQKNIDKLSRPGFKIAVSRLYFTPTLTEKEQHNALLRQKIYILAQQEINNLEAVFKDRDFRIGRIDFTQMMVDQRPVAFAMQKDQMLEKYKQTRDSGQESLNVSKKIQMSATVHLSSYFKPE